MEQCSNLYSSFRKCLFNWAALLDRHIPTSSAIAATILEIVTELHFILDSFSEVVWFVNSIFGRLCIRWSNSHYVTVRLNKPGALCLVLLRECFPPLDEQTYTYSDVGFTRIQKRPINTPIPSSADVSEEVATYTYVSFSLPLFPAPLFSHTELSWKIWSEIAETILSISLRSTLSFFCLQQFYCHKVQT